MAISSPHLLILTPGFPNDESDTTCVPYIQSLVRQLHEDSGWKISVITFQYPYQEKNYHWYDLEVYSAGGKNLRFPGKLRTWTKVWRKIKAIHKQNPVSIIHSFWLGETALLGKIAEKRLHIPHVCTLMGQDVKKSNVYLKKPFFQSIPLVAVSRFHAITFEKNTGEPVSNIIPLGIHPGNFPPLNLSERKIDILGVGGQIALKNYQLFIHIVKKLVQDFPNLNCVIIGEGPLTSYHQKLIQDLSLESHIQLTGMLPREEVFQYMNQSRILLHPSTFESFGFVFLEALYSGMSVVSFPVGAAQSSEKWKVAQNESEMYQQLVDLLREKPNYQRAEVSNMTDAARAYVEQYQTLIEK